jgi:Holliday junction resolvase RusA-like endonuclease
VTPDPRRGEFFRALVAGRPVTQGSKTAGVIPAKGNRPAHGFVRDANPKRLKPWREAVRSAAETELGDDWTPVGGPLWIDIWFALPKPAAAPKRTRTWPIGAQSGDIDKLTRAVFDALTDAGVWRDDSQPIDQHSHKDYPGPDVHRSSPGALITVGRILGPFTETRPAATLVALPIEGI